MTVMPENLPSTMGPAVPDAESKPLRWYLEGALRVMFADRVLTPDEQRDIGWFFKSVQMQVAAMQGQGVENASQMGAARQQEFQPTPMPGGGPVEDYGTGAGTPIEPKY